MSNFDHWSWTDFDEFRDETSRKHLGAESEMAEETGFVPKYWSDNQVVAPEDLEAGRVYKAHGKAGTYIFLCLSAQAYRNKHGNWAVRMIDWPTFRVGREISLADFGVIPYNNGKYNLHCWLETTADKAAIDFVERLHNLWFG